MARRRRRSRAGANPYQFATRPRVPRPELYDPYEPVYSRRSRRLVSSRGVWGGVFPPHAERPDAPVRRRQGRSRVQDPSYQMPGGVARYGVPPRNVPSLPSRLLRPLVHSRLYLMPTVLGRRNEEIRRPRRVDECGRRSERREVLFAAGVAGWAGRSPGRRGTYRRTEASNFSCGG